MGDGGRKPRWGRILFVAALLPLVAIGVRNAVVYETKSPRWTVPLELVSAPSTPLPDEVAPAGKLTAELARLPLVVDGRLRVMAAENKVWAEPLGAPAGAAPYWTYRRDAADPVAVVTLTAGGDGTVTGREPSGLPEFAPTAKPGASASGAGAKNLIPSPTRRPGEAAAPAKTSASPTKPAPVPTRSAEPSRPATGTVLAIKWSDGRLVGFDPRRGAVVWRAPVEMIDTFFGGLRTGADTVNPAGELFTVRAGGRDLLVTAGTDRVRVLDPATGAQLWTVALPRVAKGKCANRYWTTESGMVAAWYGCADTPVLNTYDAATGRHLSIWRQPPQRYDGPVGGPLANSQAYKQAQPSATPGPTATGSPSPTPSARAGTSGGFDPQPAQCVRGSRCTAVSLDEDGITSYWRIAEDGTLRRFPHGIWIDNDMVTAGNLLVDLQNETNTVIAYGRDGTEKWKHPVTAEVAELLGDESALCALFKNQTLTCWDTATGKDRPKVTLPDAGKWDTRTASISGGFLVIERVRTGLPKDKPLDDPSFYGPNPVLLIGV